jgi:hypothetical protein
MRVTTFLFFAVMLGCGAQADELDDAYKACLPYKNDISPRTVTDLSGHAVVDASASHGPLFKPGWEHCLVIHRAWLQRDAAQAESDEARNPALKSTRAIAKKLTAPAPVPPNAGTPR